MNNIRLPFLLFADRRGKIYSHPFLRMAGASPDKFILPEQEAIIGLPRGSSFFYMPHRFPAGFNPQTARFEVLKEFKGQKVYAVAAFLIPGYLRLYNPAAVIEQNKRLSLWAYTACGYYRGQIYVCARKVDARIRQRPSFYDRSRISAAVRKTMKCSPRNRLYKHLANCALNYNCLAAKNLFLNRWEAPLPTARFCNARCIGCLSHQDSDCASSHQRINFRPRQDEIEEIVGRHLKTARQAIVSFGQGCEGEPLTEADLIAAAVKRVRESVSRGTINVNTNACFPRKVELLCRAGVDSFRVSLNSVREKYYNIYFRPRNYKFRDVLKSIKIAKRLGKFVSINLFTFPGFSDSQQEISALVKFIENNGIDMVQFRNLNIDPSFYWDYIHCKGGKIQGVLGLVKTLKQEFPLLKTGYFNLPKEQF